VNRRAVVALRRQSLLTAALATLALGAPNRVDAMPGANSTVPWIISLVGSNGAAPASDFGGFTVTVRDLANNPVVGATVTIDLSFATDLEICADQLDPSVTVNCASKTVSAITDAAGQVSLTLLGGSNGAGNATTLANGGRIYANGTLIGSPTVAAFDLDGENGMGANDLAAFLSDFASGQNFGRSDYDGSGILGANDLAVFLRAFASGAQVVSCAASCP